MRPSGETDGIEVLRGTITPGWADAMIAQIAKRRYASMPGATGTPGSYQIERVTVRAEYDAVTGSNILQRAGPASVEVLDLTEETPPTPSS